MNMENKLFPRKKFWIHFVASFLITGLFEIILEMAIGHQTAMFINVPLVAYWIYIEVLRLHDANRSGWLALINLVIGIGTFAMVIIAGVLPSNYVDNRWCTVYDETK